jgi:hypothetical protein
MTDGTMIRSRPRSRDAAVEAGDERGTRRRLAPRARRTGAVVGAVAALAVSGAGMFALFAPGQTVRGEDPRVGAAVEASLSGPAPADASSTDEGVAGTGAAGTGVVPGASGTEPVRGAKPGTLMPKQVPAVLVPPKAKDLAPAARRKALVSYLERSGVPLSGAPTAVAKAARQTCTALESGAVAADFLADLARSTGYTAAQSTSFFTGATHFYCPRHSGALAG